MDRTTCWLSAGTRCTAETRMQTKSSSSTAPSTTSSLSQNPMSIAPPASCKNPQMKLRCCSTRPPTTTRLQLAAHLGAQVKADPPSGSWEMEKLKLSELTCREGIVEVAKIIYGVHDEAKEKSFELELS